VKFWCGDALEASWKMIMTWVMLVAENGLDRNVSALKHQEIGESISKD
jgi:hypothetical protein